jgi:hypothetical protein
MSAKVFQICFLWMARPQDARYLEFRRSFPKINDAEAESCYSFREEMRQCVRNLPKGALSSELPQMLLHINAFVTETVDLAVIRLPICGFLQIDTTQAISISILASFLDSTIPRLQRSLPFSDLSAVSFDPKYFHTYSQIFVQMPRYIFRRFNFMMAREEPQICDTPANNPLTDIISPKPLGQRSRELQMKLARTARKLTQLKKETVILRRKLSSHTRRAAIADSDERVEEDTEDNDEPAPDESFDEIIDEPNPQAFDIRHTILCQLMDNIDNFNSRRRYCPSMYKFSFLLNNASPKAYRILREVLPFPSVTSLTNYWHTEMLNYRDRIEGKLGCQDPEQLLEIYREYCAIPPEQGIPCTLGFDATTVSETGIITRKSYQNSFAFLVQPLHHELPDLLIHSMAHGTGRIDGIVLERKDNLVEVLCNRHFLPFFVATDGDTGMSPIHTEHFKKYEKFEPITGLEPIIMHLTQDRSRNLDCWPVSDFLHLLKNARTRIVLGTLAFDANSATITASSLNSLLNIGTALEAHNPLDLLKDDLALKTFTLSNLIKLLGKVEVIGAYFLLPFVSLNLAIRNEMISKGTRLNLIQAAFFIWFKMAKDYPQTGKACGIYESHSKSTERKTLWTRTMLQRGCNLCVGLYWAITSLGDFLALGRIGTHSLECHFGTTRSVLRGDTRWESFLSAQVDAMFVQRCLKELNLKPYIRRFKNGSGCTLMPDAPQVIDINFDGLPDKLTSFAHLVAGRADRFAILDEDSITWTFAELAERLAKAGYVEKISDSSKTSGSNVISRLFAASHDKQTTNLAQDPQTIQDEETEAVWMLADE